jgi:hypothetical protein
LIDSNVEGEAESDVENEENNFEESKALRF